MVTWDTKGAKPIPLDADEILLIDTEDSRNQKRATLGSFSKWSRNLVSNFIFPTNLVDKLGVGTNSPTAKLHVVGDAKITSTLDMSSQKVTNVLNPTVAQDAATKNYIDTKTLDTFASPVDSLSLNNQKVSNVLDPTAAQDAATKNYVDSNSANAMWTKSGANIFPTTISDEVGIGTETPAAKLHVVGNAKITGPLDMSTQKVSNVLDPTVAQDASTKNYVDTKPLNTFASPVASLGMNTQKITNVLDPTVAQDAATKNYVDTKPLNTFASPIASLSLNNQKITNLSDPTVAQDAATKNYVDTNSANAMWTKSGVNIFPTILTDKVGIGVNPPTEKLHVEGGNILQKHTVVAKLHGTIAASANMVESQTIFVVGNLAYVVSMGPNRLTIVDISNPAVPVEISSIQDNTNMVDPSGLFVAGNYAYVTSLTSNSLAIYDISNPKSIEFVGSILNDTTHFEVARAVYVSGKYAYVVASTSDTLSVVDVSNPANPVIVGFVKNETILGAAFSIYVAGRYAYVGSLDEDRLVVVDVSDPTNPVITGSVTNASLIDPYGIHVLGKYAYVTGFVSDSLSVFDISDPVAPAFVSTISNANLNGAYAVFVSGNYAYVAAQNAKALTVIDISDPTSLQEKSSYFDSGNLEGTRSVFISGKYAYLTAFDSDKFVVLDITGIEAPTASIGNIEASHITVSDNAIVKNNLYASGLNVGEGGIKSDNEISSVGTISQVPTNPILAGSITNSNLNGADSVYISGKYAYVAASNDDSLTIIDISVPTAPAFVAKYKNETILNGPDSVYVAGKYAYVAASLADRLVIIDISNPKNPTLAGNIHDPTNMNNPESVYVSGKYAYVASATTSSLAIYDISDPTAISLTGSIINDVTNLNGASSVYVAGKYAYVTGFAGNSLAVVDISNPAAPAVVDSFDDATNMIQPFSVYVSGRYAYVAAIGSSSLVILDISDPAAISLTGKIIDATNMIQPFSVYVAGKYAYVAADSSHSLAVVDVSNPAFPKVTEVLFNSEKMNQPRSVFISGKYAYVAAQNSNSLTIIDVSGIDASTANIGNVKTNNLNVTENAIVKNNLYSEGLNVGQNGIKSDGPLAVSDKGSFEDEVIISKDSGPASLEVAVYADPIATGPSVIGSRFRGTKLIPTAVILDSILLTLDAFGFDGVIKDIGGSFMFLAKGTWTNVSHPTEFSVFTTDVGSTALVKRFVINPDGSADFQNNNIKTTGRIQGSKGPNVASADAITLGAGNYFRITGGTQINHMINTDWQAGSVVLLEFAALVTVKNDAGGAAGAEQDFKLEGGDFVAAAGNVLTLVNDGTFWREVSRSV